MSRYTLTVFATPPDRGQLRQVQQTIVRNVRNGFEPTRVQHPGSSPNESGVPCVRQRGFVLAMRDHMLGREEEVDAQLQAHDLIRYSDEHARASTQSVLAGRRWTSASRYSITPWCRALRGSRVGWKKWNGGSRQQASHGST